VPDAVAPLGLRADLHARRLTMSLDAPREGRPSGRINWILRQLKDATGEVRVAVSFAETRETTSLLLAEAREYPQRLLSPTDPKREPRSFEVAISRPLGVKGGKGQGSFVRETRRQVIDFYGEIVQKIKPWQAPAPKLPEPPAQVPETPQPEPPPFVASDEREVGEGTTPTKPALESAPRQPGLDAWSPEPEEPDSTAT
jgi:hypothetical protein